MKSKKPSSAKVVDISRPKKRTAHADAPSSPQLVISKRSLIIPISEADAPATEAPAPTPEPIKTRQPVKIVPLTAPVLPSSEPAVAPTPSPAQEAPVPKPPVTPAAPVLPAFEESTAKQPVPAEPPAEPAPVQPNATTPKPELTPPKPVVEAPKPAPQAPTQPVDAAPKAPAQPASTTPETPEEVPEPDTTATTPKSSKANVQKALEDAKRQEEIQGYIQNHNFFVPINARARKRSVHVSIALTFVELFLGLLLLNLMLDAGLIELLEKIPHTNFFNLQ